MTLQTTVYPASGPPRGVCGECVAPYSPSGLFCHGDVEEYTGLNQECLLRAQRAAQNPSSPSKQKFLHCLSETRSIISACPERILMKILPAKTDTIAKCSLLRYWEARDIKAKTMKTPGCFPRTLTGLTQGCCQVHWWHCSDVLRNCFLDLRQKLTLSTEYCWKCFDVFMSVRRHFLDQTWIWWPSNKTNHKTYLLLF